MTANMYMMRYYISCHGFINSLIAQLRNLDATQYNTMLIPNLTR